MVKRGIVIGINYLNNPESVRLYGCINDAIAMQNLMIDAYGYSKENITMLRDDGALNYATPTKENIMNAIKDVIDKSNENDEIWIHYSGHGSYISDTTGEEYDRKDEVLIPTDYTTNVIVDDELKELLVNSKGLIYITMDCCHSGTCWDLPYIYRTYYNRLYRFGVGTPINNKRIFMLSGSRDEQYSMDTYNEEQTRAQGIFTTALIECCRYHNHNVSILQLNTDINLYFKTNGFSQISEYSSSSTNPYDIKLTRGKITDEEKVLTENIIQNNMKNIIYQK